MRQSWRELSRGHRATFTLGSNHIGVVVCRQEVLNKINRNENDDGFWLWAKMLILLILKSLDCFLLSYEKPWKMFFLSLFLRVIQGVLGNHTTLCRSSLARCQCSAQLFLSTPVSAEGHKTVIHSLSSWTESVRLYKAAVILLRDSFWNAERNAS